MLSDFGIKNFAPGRLERGESAFLVNAHQPTVAGDIGCEDGSQPPVDARLSHADCPYAPRFRTEFMATSRGCLSRRNHVRFGSSATEALEATRLRMSALLQKRTSECLPQYVRLVPKADLRTAAKREPRPSRLVG